MKIHQQGAEIFNKTCSFKVSIRLKTIENRGTNPILTLKLHVLLNISAPCSQTFMRFL